MAASAEQVCSHFDHLDPEHIARAREDYARMREACPVAHTEAHGGFYAVTRFKDCVEVLRDPKVFSSEYGVIIPGVPVRLLPTTVDQPDHVFYRGAIAPLLQRKAVDRKEAQVRELVNGLIDEFIEDGTVDVVDQFASKLPLEVASLYLGMTGPDAKRLSELSDTLIRASVDDPELAQEAMGQAMEMLAERLAAAAANPGDDLFSAIATYNVDGRILSPEDCLNLAWSTMAGAGPTVASALASTIAVMGVNPQMRTELAANPDRVLAAVEETLRLEAPAHALSRTLTEDYNLGGTELKKGDRVLIMFDSANYDTAEFEDPDTFRIDRSPNRHLSFGFGIHKCVGMHLARTQLRIAIEEFLRRMPDFEVVKKTGPTMTSGATWSLQELVVRFTPGRRLGAGT